MTTPAVYGIRYGSQSTEILKEQEVLGGKFDKANYLKNAFGLLPMTVKKYPFHWCTIRILN